MREVASASGTAMFDDGDRLLVVNRGGPALFVALFVLALLTGVLGLNGLVQLGLVLTDQGGFLELGLVTLGVAGVSGSVSYLLMRKRTRAKQVPPEQLPVICVLDFAAGTLRNKAGQAMAQLSDVTYGRRFQLGSSSPALVLRFGEHSILLAKGSPFGGGIGALERALQERGVVRG